MFRVRTFPLNFSRDDDADAIPPPYRPSASSMPYGIIPIIITVTTDFIITVTTDFIVTVFEM